MIRRVINRLFRLADFASLYQTDVGIKSRNQLISSEMFSYHATGEVMEVSPDSLFLGWDGLRDQHTLLRRRVVDGPHLSLMRALSGEGHLGDSEYIKRSVQGTLDFRPPQRATRKFIGVLESVYHKKIVLVREKRYAPVKVIRVGRDLFIADGKHTAALCASLGLNVRCVDATTAMLDSFYWWVHRKMLRSRKQYQIHIRHYETLLGERMGRAAGG